MPILNKKYFISVLGCQMNRSDAEKIESILSTLGYSKTATEASADLIVVVACSIRQSAIDRVYGKANNWKERRAKGKLLTILTGCVLLDDKKKMADRFDLIFDVKEINKIPQKLSKLRSINVGDYFHIDPKRQSNFSAYVPIMTGCNNFCSYCVVPYVRGREVSRSAKDIINECKSLIEEGYKEITLLGQNVNSYKSGKYNFSKLLKTIDEISGDYWLRFLTSHPKDISNDLIKVMAGGNHITPHLHFALQSGDNDILKKMNRKYTISRYESIIKKARRAIPGLMVSTDLIVGFPTETKTQFNNTVKLVKKIGFDMAYISKYSTRPQTTASEMEDNVSGEEKKRRDEKLNKVLEKSIIKNNKADIGQITGVLVENFKNGKCIGKTNTFKPISFSGDKKLVGQFTNVKITDIDNWGLRGEMTSKKLIVVLGPTACGKTSIATKLALKYKGEIVSADSRQVYLGMDIGTGKDLGDYKIGNVNIPYHLTDVVDPRVEFNVAEYQKQAYEAIDDILSRGKNPFLVGGTGLYIDAVTRGYKFVAKNSKLETKKIRKKLDKLSLNQLLIKLKKIDLSTYKTIDKKNRRRVQRAVEIFYETGITKSASLKSTLPDYDILFIGIKFPLEKIYSKIDKRLSDRIDEGMVREVKKLRKSGVSWKRLDDFGLEYRWVSRYLRGIVDYKESVEQLRLSIHRFAKRQLTWFKRNEDIMWVDKLSEADSLINKFLED